MMKRRIFASLTAFALCAALLSGCGASSDSPAADASSAPSAAVSSAPDSSAAAAENGAADADLDAAVEALLAANPISNPFEIAAMNIEYDFMLAADDVAAYKGVKSNDNGDAGLVLVIQPAAGRTESICTALEEYKDSQTAYYANYSEFAQAQANVENAIIWGDDSLVIMVIASNEAEGDLSAAVEDARAAAFQ